MDEWLFLPEQNKNWVTLVLGFNFILFVLIKVRFEQQFFSFIRLIDTPMYFNIYGEKKFISQGFTYVSGLFSLINLVLLLCFLIQPFTQTPSFNLFLILLISIGAVLILRQSILLFLGFLLDLNGFVNQYQFRNLTYLSISVFPSRSINHPNIHLLSSSTYCNQTTNKHYKQRRVIFYFVSLRA